MIKHKLLEAMRLAEADRQLGGRVEIDDAYLGGKKSGGKASVLNEKFRPVNTLIGNIKTALTGTCHAVKFAK